MKNKLNIGCGPDIKPDYINLDSLKLDGVDVVHNLNRIPYPFPDGQFDEIHASHVLEHVDDLIAVMGEIRRLLRPGGRLIARVPHFSCGVSYRDPTHRRLFSHFTWDYFTDDCFYGLPRFRIVHRKLNFTRWAMPALNIVFNPLINLSPALYERFFCWMLPCAESHCTLEAA
jgi:SAM-dependent methyltransferase